MDTIIQSYNYVKLWFVLKMAKTAKSDYPDRVTNFDLGYGEFTDHVHNAGGYPHYERNI